MNVIEIAIRMETDAINFYREAVEKTGHPIGKKMFLTITEDEKRHLEMLSQLFKGFNIEITDVSPMKNIKTIFESMKDEMMQRIETTTDELEAFKIAMQMEKEGIEFYKKAILETQGEKEQSLFEILVKEEEQHYAIFSNTYFYLSNTGSWLMVEQPGHNPIKSFMRMASDLKKEQEATLARLLRAYGVLARIFFLCKLLALN